MKRLLYVLVLAVAGVTFGVTAPGLLAKDPPPGSAPCSHGHSGKSCRDDPQPTHGKDCTPHGDGNEDHCAGTTTAEHTTTGEHTTTHETTHETTTHPTTTTCMPNCHPTTTTTHETTTAATTTAQTTTSSAPPVTTKGETTTSRTDTVPPPTVSGTTTSATTTLDAPPTPPETTEGTPTFVNPPKRRLPRQAPPAVRQHTPTSHELPHTGVNLRSFLILGTALALAGTLLYMGALGRRRR